jgi:hypothetical protein
VLLTALLAGLCWSVSNAASVDFKILKLEGNNVHWQSQGDGRGPTVTYGVVGGAADFPLARNCRKLTDVEDLTARSKLSVTAFRAELAAAFDLWQAAANITFREVDSAQADILIGAQAEPDGWAFADVFYDVHSPQEVKPISKALICLNPSKYWKIGFDGDLSIYDLRYTLAHEIGHAIGLDHPSGAGQIMGYRYDEKFRQLQDGDLQGIQQLYGERRVDTPQVASSPQSQVDTRSAAMSSGTRAFTSGLPEAAAGLTPKSQ